MNTEKYQKIWVEKCVESLMMGRSKKLSKIINALGTDFLNIILLKQEFLNLLNKIF